MVKEGLELMAVRSVPVCMAWIVDDKDTDSSRIPFYIHALYLYGRLYPSIHPPPAALALPTPLNKPASTSTATI